MPHLHIDWIIHTKYSRQELSSTNTGYDFQGCNDLKFFSNEFFVLMVKLRRLFKRNKKCVLDEIPRMFTMTLNYIAYFCSEWIIETFEVRFFLPNLSKISIILVNNYNIHIMINRINYISFTAIQSWIFITFF